MMTGAPDDAATERVAAWLSANLGPVRAIARQPRWRPVWFATVECDGQPLEVCVRGERTDMPLIFPLRHEMRFQQLLHDHGIPVAEVFGWIDDPAAYVMAKVPGEQHFGTTPDAEREAAVDHYLQILVQLHALPLQPFVDAGIAGSEPGADPALTGLRRYEEVSRTTTRHPEPFMEFCLGWLRRNPPDSRGRRAPIVWDSGQFHHQGGRITAVLDLEIGHVGDPMMDLAGWRMRDTIVRYGDFRELYRRYEQLGGVPIDLDAIARHHLAFSLTNQLVFGAAIRDPIPQSDLMTNLQWCCETNLFTTEALAELLDIELPTVDLPEAAPSGSATAFEYLVGVLGGVRSEDPYLSYQMRSGFRLARHLQRRDEIAAATEAADLDDLRSLLGHRPATPADGERELQAYVLADTEGAHDRELVELFHRRNLRAQMLLGPAGSAMTRHLPIQPLFPS
jgi:aminoglycoside phosphotransferase (APT) family kinase protein